MKRFSNINSWQYCWNKFRKEYVVWHVFLFFVFAHAASNLRSLNHEINYKKKIYRRNTHEKKFWTHKIPMKVQWHDGTKPTRPTTARDPRNLAHSSRNELFCLKEIFLKNGYPEDFTSKDYKKFMDNIHEKATTVTVEKNLHEKIYWYV